MTEKTRVLLVDDDNRLLNAAKRILRKDLDLVTAEGGDEALRLLGEAGPFAVVVSDQNMPGMNGAVLLAEFAKKAPTTVRVMLTGNNDQQTAISAVNEGRIFRFLNKPCEPADLLAAITDAIAQHRLLTAEKVLLQRTLSGSVKVLTDVLAMSNPDAFKRATLVHRWARKVGPAMGMDKPWEVDLASMLCTLGYVTLPEVVSAKYFTGAELTDEERILVDQAPANARDLIENIPRMSAIADAVYHCRKGYDGSGFPETDLKGPALPPIGRLLNTLLDLAEAMEGDLVTLAQGLAHLNRNAARHDPKVIEVIASALADDAAFTSAPTATRLQAQPLLLRSGDVVASDIRNREGACLLVAGSTLSEATIQRLRSISDLNQLAGPVDIWRHKLAA